VSDTIRVEVLICQRWSFMALKNSLFLWSCVWLEGIVVQGLYIKVWYICSVICISEASTSYIKGWFSLHFDPKKKVDFLGGFVWYGMFMTEEILETHLRFIVLDEEDTFKNRELVECRWKDNLTFPSVYWVISLIWTFGFGSCYGSGYVAPLRIKSFERVTSFHWITLGTTVFDLEMSVWSSKVSPLCDWNLCVCVLTFF